MNEVYDLQTPEEWDDYLNKEYQVGLVDFAYCLAKLIYLEDPRYGYSPAEKLPDLLKEGRQGYYGYYGLLKDQIKRHQKLKKHIIGKLRDYLKLLGHEGATDKFIIEAFRLEPFFDALHFEIYELKDMIELGKIWRRRGHPVSLTNKIAFVWAQAIRHKGKIRWKTIDALLIWFHKKIGETNYANLLVPIHNVNYFKKEYLLVTNDRQRKEDLKKFADAFFFSDCRNRSRSLFGIEFRKDYFDIFSVHARKPFIKFPDGMCYYPKLRPVQENTMGKEALPLFLTKVDIQALKKYVELRKNQGYFTPSRRSPHGPFRYKRN
jgi:hypothetical protein